MAESRAVDRTEEKTIFERLLWGCSEAAVRRIDDDICFAREVEAYLRRLAALERQYGEMHERLQPALTPKTRGAIPSRTEAWLVIPREFQHTAEYHVKLANGLCNVIAPMLAEWVRGAELSRRTVVAEEQRSQKAMDAAVAALNRAQSQFHAAVRVLGEAETGKVKKGVAELRKKAESAEEEYRQQLERANAQLAAYNNEMADFLRTLQLLEEQHAMCVSNCLRSIHEDFGALTGTMDRARQRLASRLMEVDAHADLQHFAEEASTGAQESHPFAFVPPPAPEKDSSVGAGSNGGTGTAQPARECEEDESAITQKLGEVLGRLEGYDMPLAFPGRRFIREGPLVKISRGHRQMRYFFLLTDILLYGERKKKKNTVAYKGQIPLNMCLVRACENSKFGHAFEVVSVVKKKVVVLIASSAEEKESWIGDLQVTVDAVLEVQAAHSVRQRSAVVERAREAEMRIKRATQELPHGAVLGLLELESMAKEAEEKAQRESERLSMAESRLKQALESARLAEERALNVSRGGVTAAAASAGEDGDEQARISELLEQVRAAEERAALLEVENRRQREAAEAQQQQEAEEIAQARLEMEEALGASQARVDEAEQSLAQAQAAAAALEPDDVAAAEAALAQVSEAEERLRDTEGARAALQEQLQVLQLRADAAEKEREQLREEAGRLQRELEAGERVAAEQRAAAAAAATRADESERARDAEQQRATKAMALADSSAAEAQKLQEQLSVTQAELAEARAAVEAGEDSDDEGSKGVDAERQLIELEARAKEMEQLQADHAGLEEAARAAQQRAREAEARSTSDRSRIEEAEKKLQALQATVREREAAAVSTSAASSKMNEMERQLREAEQRCRALEEQMEERARAGDAVGDDDDDEIVSGGPPPPPPPGPPPPPPPVPTGKLKIAGGARAGGGGDIASLLGGVTLKKSAGEPSGEGSGRGGSIGGGGGVELEALMSVKLKSRGAASPREPAPKEESAFAAVKLKKASVGKAGPEPAPKEESLFPAVKLKKASVGKAGPEPAHKEEGAFPAVKLKKSTPKTVAPSSEAKSVPAFSAVQLKKSAGAARPQVPSEPPPVAFPAVKLRHTDPRLSGASEAATASTPASPRLKKTESRGPPSSPPPARKVSTPRGGAGAGRGSRK